MTDPGWTSESTQVQSLFAFETNTLTLTCSWWLMHPKTLHIHRVRAEGKYNLTKGRAAACPFALRTPTPALWFVCRIYRKAIRYVAIIKAVSREASSSLRKTRPNDWSKTDSARSFTVLDWAWNEISNLMLTTEIEMISADFCLHFSDSAAEWWDTFCLNDGGFKSAHLRSVRPTRENYGSFAVTSNNLVLHHRFETRT